jgi:Fe-S-cluster containining protein
MLAGQSESASGDEATRDRSIGRDAALRNEQGFASTPMPRTKWYQAGLSFTCTQCGNCCSGEPGYVWLTKSEIRRISEYLGRSDAWLDRSHLRRVGFRYSLTERPDGDCIFLDRREDGSTGCSIYPVRPLQCRTWPFWNQNLWNEGSWNDAHTKCPGMNRGKQYTFEEIEAIRTKKDW